VTVLEPEPVEQLLRETSLLAVQRPSPVALSNIRLVRLDLLQVDKAGIFPLVRVPQKHLFEVQHEMLVVVVCHVSPASACLALQLQDRAHTDVVIARITERVLARKSPLSVVIWSMAGNTAVTAAGPVSSQNASFALIFGRQIFRVRPKLDRICDPVLNVSELHVWTGNHCREK